MEPLKWIDNTVSVTSTSKFLSSIHPVVKDLNQLLRPTLIELSQLDQVIATQ
jgi:hypothetical protein